jgi:small subunit ribosomal protein S6e
VIEDEGKLVTT